MEHAVRHFVPLDGGRRTVFVSQPVMTGNEVSEVVVYVGVCNCDGVTLLDGPDVPNKRLEFKSPRPIRPRILSRFSSGMSPAIEKTSVRAGKSLSVKHIFN